MYILGIDPGSKRCGYAIISATSNKLSLIAAGFVNIKSMHLQEQILDLIEALNHLLDIYEVNEVAIEDIFFGYNPKSVIKLAQFRGALSLKILERIGNFSEYTPLQVKKALTGNGKASKEQVAFMVKRLLNITNEIKPLDISDAMAVAITHAQRLRLNLK
ncbi:crossover junction endodeoxyribonuclease RuvC [Helicobacter cetorum]|uniref:Crossover junction endodeoxyribonuclease RuvC n=1 Tax=Helicobacter cetorum (strain ATCC BAA-540 / CCUG 52418 / MIT 99-5656) TaxID=1163745 RepID=I0ER30_HELCM|nr:crossover junction endodeoxyribonuclease RuvC [Helicobacter cetorum]AFI05399.1 Holliday junction resolvase [Helicobacter cetorum MIT 99-5656]